MIAFVRNLYKLLAVSLALVGFDAKGRATEVDVQWRTGTQLTRQLNESVNVAWQRTTLRSALSKTSRLHRVAIFLDRRVDPNQEISLTSEANSLKELFDQIAKKASLEITWIGAVAYFGPAGQTKLAKTLLDIHSQRIRQLTVSLRKQWQHSIPVEWTELSEPRRLVVNWCESASVTIHEVRQVEHDLWHAGNLPAMNLAEKLTLALLGFAMTFEIEQDGSCRVIPIANLQIVKRSFLLPKQARQRVAELQKLVSPNQLVVQGTVATLTASLDQHVAVDDWLLARQSQIPDRRTQRNKKNSGRPDESSNVYTLTIKNQPFRPVILSLGKKLNLDVKFGEALSTEQLSKTISFSVENVSLDKLLKTVTESAGLEHQVEGRSLIIGEKGE